MHTLLKLLLATTLAVSATIANAAFINTTSGVGSKSGFYLESESRGSLSIQGDRRIEGNAYSQLEDTFATAGVFSFDWSLSGNGNTATGGYLLNGTKFELGFTNAFTMSPSGTISVTLAAGDAFGWYVETNLVREHDSANFNLRNASFTASPSAVPVPAAAWLFGSALLGVAGLRRKQHA